jgi:menaquinol-cytochrome c reductase iron-sulfur subunit
MTRPHQLPIPEAEQELSNEAKPTIETRRTLFAGIIGIASGLIGLGLAIPLAGYVISPALKRREASWVEVAPTDRLQTGKPVELEYVGTVKDGWRTVTAKKSVWAVKQPASGIVVFSSLCPHLGCGFR